MSGLIFMWNQLAGDGEILLQPDIADNALITGVGHVIYGRRGKGRAERRLIIPGDPTCRPAKKMVSK